MHESDKYCSICVDEMSLKCNVYYDYGYDLVIGFEDDGILRSSSPANYVTVIMARGKEESWKQPLGYIFTSSCINAQNLKTHLDNFIHK